VLKRSESNKRSFLFCSPNIGAQAQKLKIIVLVKIGAEAASKPS